jgi:hypothetical protein
MTTRKAKPLTYELAHKLHAEMRHDVSMSRRYLRQIEECLVRIEKTMDEFDAGLVLLRPQPKGNKAA